MLKLLLILLLSPYFGCASFPEAFKNEWSLFLKQKGYQKQTSNYSEEYQLVEEFSEKQLVRRRFPIPTMDRDPRWTPYVENRVTLSDGTEMSASPIVFKSPFHSFIASQAPKESNYPFFWKMVWEKDIDQIVMVTELSEGERDLCYPYWPTDSGTLVLDNGIVVTLLDENTLLSNLQQYLLIRRYRVSYEKEEKILTHYWYRNWPDHSFPEETLTLLTMVDAVKKDKKTQAPILVHCSGGIGRTGIFIFAFHFQQRQEFGEDLSLFDFAAYLRWQRPRIISKPQTYQFFYRLKECLLEKGAFCSN